MIEFNNEGLLPPGDYPMTIDDLKQSILVNGSTNNIDIKWDSAWRLNLVNNLEIMANQIWTVQNAYPGKIGDIYIAGSFVENKTHPSDIDGYFECDVLFLATMKLHQELNLLDPYKIWTWNPESRRPCKGSTKKQLPMWHRYNVELYPDIGTPSGILDEFGKNQQFPAAFRKTRNDFKAKGIIKLIKA